MARTGREQRKSDDLRDALAASTDLSMIMKDGFPSLVELAAADCGALAVTSLARPNQYTWYPLYLHPDFFKNYETMERDDRVLQSVHANVGVPMRDSDMIRPQRAERNPWRDRMREQGIWIRKIQAVMLLSDDELKSGLSLYRLKKRPFSDHDLDNLRYVTQPFALAVRRCRQIETANRCRDGLETALGADHAVILIQAPTRELDRTANATALLKHWFGPDNSGEGCLPHLVREGLKAAQAEAARGALGPWPCDRENQDGVLLITISCQPTPDGEPLWRLTLSAWPYDARLPLAWRDRLSPRDRDVATRMLDGWSNRRIAKDLRCTEANIKWFVRRVLDACGADDRKHLQAMALIERRRLM